ncbi:MAG: carboxymuconolactone decarboxylase family protein [Nannocystales bacterium]
MNQAPMPFFDFLPAEAHIGHLLFHNVSRFGHFQRFAHDVLRGRSELSTAERELIAAYVSGLNECSFCYGVHRETARKYGVDPDLLESLVDDVERAPVSAKDRALFRYIRKLTLEPAKVVESDARAAFHAGVEQSALHDAVVICGVFSCYNRLLDGHGIGGSPEAFTDGAGMLYRYGYRIPWFARFFFKP